MSASRINACFIHSCMLMQGKIRRMAGRSTAYRCSHNVRRYLFSQENMHNISRVSCLPAKQKPPKIHQILTIFHVLCFVAHALSAALEFDRPCHLCVSPVLYQCVPFKSNTHNIESESEQTSESAMSKFEPKYFRTWSSSLDGWQFM